MAWEYKSMLSKSRERSAAKKYLNRNLAAGHRTPNEHYLERAGLRGRKLGFCCGFIFLLFLFALIHLAVTCFILAALHFDTSGFQYFTFRGSSTVWPLGANLSNISIAAPHDIRAYRDSTLTFNASQDTQINLEVSSSRETLSSLSLDEDGINVSVGEGLSVRNRDGSRQLLYGDSSTLQVQTLSAQGGLKTSSLTTSMVSGLNNITSSQQLVLTGVGGVTAGGGVVNIRAEGGATLTGQRVVINGGINLQGLLPASSTPADTYHLCLRANGTLFLVPRNQQGCLGPT